MPEKAISLNRLADYDKKLKEILSIWSKNTDYSLDTIIEYKGNYLKCTTAGKSGATTLNFTNLDIGDTINDGNCVWTIIDLPSKGTVYSTTERVVGTWIDGKQLYRKVFNNPTNGLSTGLTSALVSIKRVYGHVIQSSNGIDYNFDIPNHFSNGGVSIYLVRSTGVLEMDEDGNDYIGTITYNWVAVEYTKN